MQIQFSSQNQKLLVKPEFDRLDMSVAADFKKRCLEAAGDVKSLVIDLSAIRFIDSAGLGAMVGMLHDRGTDATIELVAPQKSVRLLLEITRLDTIFQVRESLDRIAA